MVKTECLHGVSLRGGPSSETGPRSQRKYERVRGEQEQKEWKERSEAAGTQAKQGQVCPKIALFDDLLGMECRFIYMYNKAP